MKKRTTLTLTVLFTLVVGAASLVQADAYDRRSHRIERLQVQAHRLEDATWRLERDAMRLAFRQDLCKFGERGQPGEPKWFVNVRRGPIRLRFYGKSAEMILKPGAPRRLHGGWFPDRPRVPGRGVSRRSHRAGLLLAL